MLEERRLSSTSPFGDFRTECEKLLKKALTKTHPDISFPEIHLDLPPTHEFGDLASTLCFEISKSIGEKPGDLAEKIVENIDLSDAKLVESVKVAGAGYINFHANYANLASLALETVLELGTQYGFVKTDDPVRVIVEHTSANPAGPIHIGTARNSVIGDSLARMLRARGHKIDTHFYVDDVGRQVAVVAYGYRMLEQPEPRGKPDYWVGNIYAVTSSIISIRKLKKKIQELKSQEDSDEELKKTQAELDDWAAAAVDLHDREPEMFDRLFERIEKEVDPEVEVNVAMRLYEEEDPEVKKVFRKIVDFSLDGFKETYKRFGISYDSWDWESDLVWSGAVSDVVAKLGRTPYAKESKGTLVLDVENAARFTGVKEKFGVAADHEIPPLVLMRSDGTTLYTTRDIAYSLWKFDRADKVVNVIGVEQSLAQLQLRVAVSLLTSPEKAQNLMHYAYELVDMPGYKMSSRRGRYVTLDAVMDESIQRALEEVEKRSSFLPDEVKKHIAESVGLGAIKYSLIGVMPLKKVIFDWGKVLNFETNSAPFIQYAYARACNILNKAEVTVRKPDFCLLKDSLEKSLVKVIAMFPEVFVDAVEDLEPNQLAEFANDLAARFNSFYAKLPVLKAGKPALRDARLSLVEAFKITVGNILNLLGIEALERM